MFKEEESKNDILEEMENLDTDMAKENSCICINVFVKCDKDHPLRKETGTYGYSKKKNDSSCVCINVFVECDDDCRHEKKEKCFKDSKKKNDSSCVCINLFVKCDKDLPWEKEAGSCEEDRAIEEDC